MTWFIVRLAQRGSTFAGLCRPYDAQLDLKAMR
jgi:hypothetical protein